MSPTHTTKHLPLSHLSASVPSFFSSSSSVLLPSLIRPWAHTVDLSSYWSPYTLFLKHIAVQVIKYSPIFFINALTLIPRSEISPQSSLLRCRSLLPHLALIHFRFLFARNTLSPLTFPAVSSLFKPSPSRLLSTNYPSFLCPTSLSPSLPLYWSSNSFLSSLCWLAGFNQYR